ncbi:MAG: O-phosphoserine--tRNA ligase [Methanocellales archaeon]|nr:O-phosphoserine--tRNA ligase [Methanocellales archaeon]
MKFDPDEIKEQAKKNFEKTWSETARFVIGKRSFTFPKKRGKKHLLTIYSDKAKDILLDMGFDEVMLKPIWEDQHVRLQYGPEAPAILDRLYYLATLPRPDIGLSDEKKKLIRRKIKGFDRFEELQDILMDYKREKIVGGEDFTEALVTRLGIKTEDAHYLINEIFSELKGIKPVSSSLTLLSHITTAWFPTLQAVQDKRELPVMLFTFGWRFRREQREDATHMRAHYNISMVVMDEDLTIADGKYITEEFFRRMGYEVKFRQKPSTPAYYAPGTNYEVFVKHPEMGWVEVTEIGMYSPIALANYDIKYPVFNSGPGLGRMIMLSEDISDIREVHFPEIYAEFRLSDEQIAEMVCIDKTPETSVGKKIARAIVKTCEKHGNEPSPCSFDAWKGELKGKQVVVSVVEPEENTKLCGPAFLNEVVVYNGDVIGVPRTKKHEELLEKVVKTNIRFIDGFAALAAHEIEHGCNEIRIRIARSHSDVNLRVDPVAIRYIQSNNKKLDIRGPVFTTVRVER